MIKVSQDYTGQSLIQLCLYFIGSLWYICFNLHIKTIRARFSPTQYHRGVQHERDTFKLFKWAAPSDFDTYRLCEQRRFRRACASAQSRQNLRCSLIQAVSQEEPSDRKPDPWPR